MSSRLPPQMPNSRVLASMQRAPLQAFIMILTILGAAWGLAFGVQSFRDISFDRSVNGGSSLVTFDIIIGSLMCAFAAMMLVGFCVAFANRPTLARIFSYTSIIAALTLCAGQLFIVIAHFRFKSQILDECQTAVTNLTVFTGNPFWFGYSEHTLSASDAANFCNNAFTRQSATDIIWFIAAIVASAIFLAIAIAWSYQVLDPSYGRSAPPRADAIRMGSFYPNGQPRYDAPPGPYPQQNPFADNADAFIPPYDTNMPPKYAKDMEQAAPVEKGGHDEHQPMYGSDREAWAASDTDLAGPRIQERRPEDI